MAESGELVQPRTGKPQPPTPLDGQPLGFDDPADRRVSLAKWLTAPENPYFARSITNRVWANFFGVGLVEKVDDMRVSNPASNDALLTAAADYLVAAEVRSESPDEGHPAVERLSAVQPSARRQPQRAPLLFALLPAADDGRGAARRDRAGDRGADQVRLDRRFPGADRQKTDFYPVGTRAVQLYDAAVENYFLQAFGRNQRRIVCECERSDEPTMVQVLHISNGDTLNEKLKTPGNRVDKLLSLRRQGMSDSTLLDEIYLACLARYPAKAERSQLLALLPPSGADEERRTVEDIFWGLMSSREFLFNH